MCLYTFHKERDSFTKNIYLMIKKRFPVWFVLTLVGFFLLVYNFISISEECSSDKLLASSVLISGATIMGAFLAGKTERTTKMPVYKSFKVGSMVRIVSVFSAKKELYFVKLENGDTVCAQMKFSDAPYRDEQPGTEYYYTKEKIWLRDFEREI